LIQSVQMIRLKFKIVEQVNNLTQLTISNN
jgi:hypothetical protein